MKAQVNIKRNPRGFAECVANGEGYVKEVAEKRAAEMQAEKGGTGNYTVEMKYERWYKDPSYRVDRPVAIARIYADAEATKDEAENKTMSKVISR